MTSALSPKTAARIEIPSFSEGMRLAMPKAIAGAVISGGVGAGMVGASMLAQQHRAQRAKQEKAMGFEKMLEKSPDLASSEKPEQVMELYDSLHGLAPTVASHPHLAGSLIRSAINYGEEGFSPDVASNLIKMEGAHAQNPGQMAKMDPVSRLAIFGSLPSS